MVLSVTMLIDADERYASAYAAHWPDVFRFALSWTNDWAAASKRHLGRFCISISPFACSERFGA